MSFGQLEFLLMILVRVSGFFVTAPFFNQRGVPQRVKMCLSVLLSVLLFTVVPYTPLSYTGVIGFAIVIMQEMIAGLVLGFFGSAAHYILTFVGQRIDMDIGFSMVNEYDPVSSSQVTISANLYNYAVLLMMFITNMHHYVLAALVDSFAVLPVGQAELDVEIYKLMIQVLTNYFIIGFRIVLPMFASILIVNTVLAILAKVAPQMNMFVIGMQLKVFVGLIVLLVMIRLLPGVAELIFSEMLDNLRMAAQYLVG